MTTTSYKMMSEFPAEFSHVKPRSANGEAAQDVFGSKKSAVLNKAFASEKMLKSSSLLSSKKSQMQQQQNSSSSEMFQENRNFSRSVSVTSSGMTSVLSSAQQRAYSVEEVDDQGQTITGNNSSLSVGGGTSPPPPQEVRFEQKSCNSSTHSLLSADGYTAEKSAATNKELKRMQAGDLSYEEKRATSAMKAKLEGDGFCAEKMAATHQEQKQLKSGDTLQQQNRKAMTSAVKLSTDEFTAEKVARSKQEERQMFSQGMMHQERNVKTSSKMAFSSSSTSSSINTKSLSCSQNLSSDRCMSTSPIGDQFALPSSVQKLAITQGIEEDLEILSLPSATTDIERASARMRSRMELCVEKLKLASADDEAASVLSAMNEMIRKAWAIPTVGYELGFSLCNILRKNGGLDILIENCSSESDDLQFFSAQVLEQCLSTENRAYVVEKGLERVVGAACSWRTRNSVSHSRVGIGILEHLFKHSEATCDDVVRMGGLETVLYECRTKDVETLRHCATALANLSLYGGPENQKAMIKSKVPVWLFPLAFHYDDNIKYYACLSIAALVANKEIEAAVLRSGTLDLVEPFVSTHSPEEFATSSIAHVHGQSKNWLHRLVPVLNSTREEARSLAAFHFAMEAGIKKRQGNTAIFHEIGAVEALKSAASSPNAIASKFAAQALLLIGETVPHKLSQQVPLWTVEDVREWVGQIGFSQYCQQFLNSRVDGDLLLQLSEEMLKDDINIQNGILRKRFLRELSILKRMADYSSCDPSNVNQLLQQLGPEFSQYTYSMLRCGVDRDTLRFLTEEQLERDFTISNTIHKIRIGHAIRSIAQSCPEEDDSSVTNKCLDVFVSYRRSNGSQLASLLKVHLQLRGFSVFIDVERLEAGKFDNNLLNSIQQAKHFLLVLTPNALDRCIGDNDCKDWVHKEIVEALQSQCNIIPILDNFQWPEPEMLPEDMRAVCYFNGVRWIHDYQDACVDKLERFMRGEMNVRSDGPLGRYVGMGGPGTPGTPGTTVTRAPVYQRSASNESAKGSNGSDNGRVQEH